MSCGIWKESEADGPARRTDRGGEEPGERELEEARRNMEKYADYRTYLSFDMEQLVEGMAPARLSRMPVRLAYRRFRST